MNVFRIPGPFHFHSRAPSAMNTPDALVLRVGRPLAIAFVFLLIGAVVVFLCFYFAEGYVWDRDINNQQIIGKAYVDFYLATKHCPASLEELVQAGYLPRRSSFYVEPPTSGNAPVDAGLSCYVVQPPPSGSIEELKMIGRRTVEGNRKALTFDPVANAFIRDEIIEKQVPRDERSYSNYIAPLKLSK